MLPRPLLLSAALSAALLLVAAPATAAQPAKVPALDKLPGVKPRNVVIILSDDHRFDAMGFMKHPFLKTPHLDSLAKNGVHFKNAFATTALCSPSRASILTGLYAHRHRVVDNNNPVPDNLIFFAQYLQAAGYRTAFIGKWHMGGDSDAPQRGFDRWVSFKGQGTYLPTGPKKKKAGTLNVDGKDVPRKGYITDELTDYAVDWLKSRPKDRPFLLFLSHKAVHSDFVPADRHKGLYKNAKVDPKKTQADTPENYAGKPMWLKNQRNSWHGVDFPYHSRLDVAEYYRRYCETLLAMDDSVGRVLDLLRAEGILDSTLVIYLSDNGFLFGEHGLIDKRVAYEPSIRIPMLMQCRDLFKPGTAVEKLVLNMDMAPTILEAAGLKAPAAMDGKSMLPLARGEKVKWREDFLYEYYWERNFPHTPTVHAVRGERYVYMRYHGIWDTDELYDLQNDPDQTRNLIRSADHQATARQLNQRLFEILRATEGMSIPLLPDRGGQQNLRSRDGSRAADFPDYLRK